MIHVAKPSSINNPIAAKKKMTPKLCSRMGLGTTLPTLK